METTTKPTKASVITHEELLKHWLGHRLLTRRTIEAFPEDQIFSFTIGGMRPFSGLLGELLAIAGPGMREIAIGNTQPLNEHISENTTKEEFLKLWDEASAEIEKLWKEIPEERFHDHVNLFGQYEGTVSSSIFYFIDNEIHHRAQAYVYLRALGIEPPFFWER